MEEETKKPSSQKDCEALIKQVHAEYEYPTCDVQGYEVVQV